MYEMILFLSLVAVMSEVVETRKESIGFTDDSTSSIASRLQKSISGPGSKIMGTVGKRKPSFAKLAVSTTESIRTRRATKSLVTDLPDPKLADEKLKYKMENTYKMIPDDGTQFSTPKVRKEIYKVFENYLGDVTYDPIRCAKMCLDLSVLVKDKIKGLDFPRYKIISNVIIGQCNDQGLESASRSIWDAKNDNFAYVVYTNTSLFAIGIVHGIYFE